MKVFDILSQLQAAAPHRLTGSTESAAARGWILALLRDQGFEPVVDDISFRTAGSLSRFAMLLNAWFTLTLGWFAASINPWLGLACLALINLFDFVLAPRIARSAEVRGANLLVGINRPWPEIAAAPRRLLIVTAHYDTAKAEPSWLRRWLAGSDNLYSLAAIGFGALILFWLASAVLGLWPGAGAVVDVLAAIWITLGRWITVVLCLPIALAVSLWMSRVFFDRELVSPGADDNGSGVAVALRVAPLLRELVSVDQDVALILVDSEEAGLRGTRDFVRRHAGALDPAATTIINLDCVGRGDTLVSIKGQGLIRQRRADPMVLAQWDAATRDLAGSHAATWMTFFSAITDQDAWLSRGFIRTLSISHGAIVPRRMRALIYRAFGITADPVDIDWAHVHSPDDSLDGISPQALETTAGALLAFARGWADAGGEVSAAHVAYRAP